MIKKFCTDKKSKACIKVKVSKLKILLKEKKTIHYKIRHSFGYILKLVLQQDAKKNYIFLALYHSDHFLEDLTIEEKLSTF